MAWMPPSFVQDVSRLHPPFEQGLVRVSPEQLDFSMKPASCSKRDEHESSLSNQQLRKKEKATLIFRNFLSCFLAHYWHVYDHSFWFQNAI